MVNPLTCWGWGTGGGWMMFFWILFWIALIIFIVWGVIRLTQNTHVFTSEDPVTLLKKRYAKGEITKKEYEEMKKELDKR